MARFQVPTGDGVSRSTRSLFLALAGLFSALNKRSRVGIGPRIFVFSRLPGPVLGALSPRKILRGEIYKDLVWIQFLSSSSHLNVEVNLAEALKTCSVERAPGAPLRV